MKKFALTLAEVLIALGIIGIIAAITLPSVIDNFKIKQLKNAFKKSSSNLEQVLLQTANEMGYSNFREINSISGISQDTVFQNQLQNTFKSKLKIIKEISNPPKFKNARGTENGFYYGVSDGTSARKLYILNDGSSVSSLSFFHHGDSIAITIDTNGPYRGPNRLGFDVFKYHVNPNIYNARSCNTDRNVSRSWNDDTYWNGQGCYSDAISNINRHTKKPYWETLKF